MLFLLEGVALKRSLLVCRYSCGRTGRGRHAVVGYVLYIRLYISEAICLLSTPQGILTFATISVKVVIHPVITIALFRASWHMVILAADGNVYAHGVSSLSQRKNT